MKRFLKFVLMLGPPIIAVGWTFLVTNFFGIALDRATFSAPGNGNVPVYNSTSKTWKVGSAGGTVGIQLNGSPVTGSPASTINLQNGLTVVGNVTGGVATLQPNYGTGPSTVPPGNDTRFNAAPAAAGKLSVDTGSAWHSIAAGAANTLLHGAGAADPTWSQLVDADITAGTITAGSLATATVNRLMLTPATIGRIEVDGGAGNPPVALAQGTSVQFLQSGGAAANPGFVSFSGDFTVAAGGLATLASTISAAGPIGDGTHVAQITFDAKGRLTAVTSVAITASGSTIALQNGGSGVTGSPAGTLNATNGLTFGTVSAGVSALAPTYGTGSNTFTQGNDTRLNTAPTAALKVAVDTSSAWGETAAGTADQIWAVNHAASAVAPQTVGGDLTYASGNFTIGANKVTLGDLATLTGLSFMGSSGSSTATPVAITGTANQIPVVNNAGSALAFVTVSGDLTNVTGAFTIGANKVSSAKVDSTVTINAGTNAKTGDQAYGNHGTTNQAFTVYTDQAGSPGTSGKVQNNAGSLELHDGTRACRIPRVLFTNTTDIGTVANQTTNASYGGASFFSFVAGDLVAGRVITIDADGFVTTAATASQSVNFEIDIGGTKIFDGNGLLVYSRAIGRTKNAFHLHEAFTVRSAGLSGSIFPYGNVMLGFATSTSVDDGAYAAVGSSVFAAAAVTLPGSGAVTILHSIAQADVTETSTLNNVLITSY